MSLLRKNIGILYIFLVAIQVGLLSQYLANSLPISRPNYFYYESVTLFFNDHKRAELIAYSIGVIAFALMFLGILLGENRIDRKCKRYINTTFLALSKLNNKKLTIIAFTLFILLPAIIFYSKGEYIGKFIFQLIGLIFTLLLPFWNYLIRYKAKQIKYIINVSSFLDKYLVIFPYKSILNAVMLLLQKKMFYLSLMFIGFLQLGYLFYDPIIHQPKIITEYLDVPETTILDNGQKIENSSYFEQLKIENSLLEKKILDPFSTQQLGDSKTDVWLELNKFEIHWQILSRYMIHHNSFMFVPIGDFALDKNISMINAQYGLGSAWLFEKILTWSNHLSLDGWLKLSYLFYFFYFGLFISIVWLITRSFAWTALIFLLSLTWVNKRGYDFLLLPPGESPWRHFFDIVIAYFLYQYVEKKNFSYYLLALTLGIVSVIINPQLGLMIFLATITAGLFYAYYEKQQVKRVLASSISALVFALVCYKFSSSANDLVKYYLDGVIGFPITFAQMLKLFVIISIGYILFWKILKDRLALNYIHIVFLMMYSQELILYIVWHYSGDGFKSRAFIYILTMAFLIFPFRKMVTERWKNYVIVGITSIIAISYLGSVFHVLKGKREYEKIFDRHITYQWNMDRAHIISTMNPIYFQNGVDLIQKYSHGQNGIYIISEYDNFLPFLANKYSLMPFFDMKWYLMTPKELNKSMITLQVNKPEYIFIDSAINRNMSNEIIPRNLTILGSEDLYQESIWRVQRLKLLSEIYNKGIATNYRLIEKGYLISVYKKCNN